MANYLDLSGKSTVAGGGRLPKLRGQIRATEAVAGAKTLVDTDSGNVYVLGAAAAVTLPALKSGVVFTFVVGAAGGTVASAAANFKVGGVGISVPATGTTLTVAAGADAGDIVEVYCDGTNYFGCTVGAAGNFTVA